MLKVRRIVSTEQLTELRFAWEKLWDQSPTPSPFLSYEWFWCCIACYGHGKMLSLLGVMDGSELVGIAPFWRYHETVRKIHFRKIGFITCPDTQFVDFLVAEPKKEAVLRAILCYWLIGERTTWDLLTLDQWPAESPNGESVKGILHELNVSHFVRTASFVPYISVQGNWEEFWRSKSQRFRKSHRNVMNRISKLNNVEVQCFQEDKTGSVFKDVLAVSEKSWKKKEGIAISSRETTQRFFEMLTEFAGQKNWLLVWLLKVNHAPVAMEYDLKCGGKVFALRADFDEEFSECSPGTYLEHQIIKHTFDTAAIEYSFGPGMNTYKLHWAEHQQENLAISICNYTLKGTILWALEEHIIPLFRRARNLNANVSSQLEQTPSSET